MKCPRCKATRIKVYETALVGITYDASDPDNILVEDSDDYGDTEAEDMSPAKCLSCGWEGDYQDLSPLHQLPDVPRS